jgi:outer membrane protein
MATRQISIQRSSVTSVKPFESVVAALNAALGHPNMGEFARKIASTENYGEMESVVQPMLGKYGLMEFIHFDVGMVLARAQGLGAPKSLRLVIGNPLTMQAMTRQVPDATKDTLKTAQTTQDAAEAQLRNGRSTLPDVLNARAETSQAVFDEESADGDERISRVELRNAIGVEPSPDISIDDQGSEPLPQSLTLSIDELVDRTLADRPDLMAQAAEIRAADSAVRAAKAEYGPRMSFSSAAAQTSLWPTASYGQIGSASKPTWSAAFDIEWRIFDGGARKHDLTAAESRRREAQDNLTDKRDQATRQVWSSYIAFRTAIRKEQAAVALLESANASYSASLDAYKYGVKNLVDVVTAEKQLALARLSGVSACSELLLQAVNLEFVTGNLLRTRPPATKPQPPGAPKR